MTEVQFLEIQKQSLLSQVSAIDLRLNTIRSENNSTVSADSDKTPRMLTVKEAAAETGLSYDHVRKLCITGKVKHVLIGSKRLVNAESLRAYLQEGC